MVLPKKIEKIKPIRLDYAAVIGLKENALKKKSTMRKSRFEGRLDKKNKKTRKSRFEGRFEKTKTKNPEASYGEGRLEKKKIDAGRRPPVLCTNGLPGV